jgi:transposase
MSDRTNDSKRHQLARGQALHPNPEKVTDPLFQHDPFFDACDAVQVKYEMLRAVRVEGRMASQTAAQFGFSRPTFYQAQTAFERAGIPGLLPAKKGPQRAHKLTGTVMAFIDRELEGKPTLTMTMLAERIHESLGITVHPRSVKRALARRAKKNL